MSPFNPLEILSFCKNGMSNFNDLLKKRTARVQFSDKKAVIMLSKEGSRIEMLSLYQLVRNQSVWSSPYF